MKTRNTSKTGTVKTSSWVGLTRREFIGGAAAFTIVPRHVLGGAKYTPPSEKLNIAAIGAGGMGANNIDNCQGENIVALCDVDDKQAAQTYKKYPKAKKYRDFRRMLEKQKDIEAVIVATPDHTHAVAAMTAMQMGKHVYVQKPLTHSIYETRKLVEAARETKVATQMGNQGNSYEGVRLICEWLWDGAIGPVQEVYVWTDRPGGRWPQGVGRPTKTQPAPRYLDWDLWLGPAPQRPYHPIYAPFRWRGWWDFGTGALGDMGCHIMNAAYRALKLHSAKTFSVEACSTQVNSETYPLASIVRYRFGPRGDMPPVKMSWYDGGLMPARPQELEETRKMAFGDTNGGMLFVGDKGKLMACYHGTSPRLIPETKMQQYTLPAKTIPRVGGSHEQNWIDACKGGEAACSNFEYSGPLTEMVLLGNIAIRTGERLDWDSENMKVTNVPTANEYIQREYRQGWSL